MAIYTGTSTNYLDLLADLSTNLVLEGWTEEDQETIDGEEYYYFSSPNITVGGSTVNVYVNIRTISNVTDGYFNWLLFGATAYDSGSTFETQPGQRTPNTTGSGDTLEFQNPCLTLHNSTIEYWMVINDRRFIVIAKVGTNFMNAYCGLILPYGTPTEYPYPLYIAGNCGLSRNTDDLADFTMGSCFDPAIWGGYLRLPDASWHEVKNFGGTTSKQISGGRELVCFPYSYDRLFQLLPAPGGSPTFPIMPCALVNNGEGGNAYGELDGVFWIPGEGATAEDTFTISAEDYLVTQNAYRSTREDIAVVKIE